MTSRQSAVILAFVVTLPAPVRAQASPGGIEVSWVRAQGAEACPSPETIRADVLRRLGRERAAGLGGHSVETVVRGEPGAWFATIYDRAPDGHLRGVRPISSDAKTCGPLALAATLAITLMIDPEASAPTPAAPEPQPPPPPAAPLPVTPPAGGPRPVPAAQPSLTGSVSFRGIASAGVLSMMAPGVELSVEWAALRRLTISTGVLWLPEARKSYWVFGFGLTAGSVGACFEAVRTAAIALGACGSVLAGAVQGFAHGSVWSTSYRLGDQAWGAFAPSLRFNASPVSPLVLTAGVEAVIPFVRYQLEPYSTNDSIFQQPVVGGIAFGGVGVTFGQGSRD